jgi:hypothetical protein
MSLADYKTLSTTVWQLRRQKVDFKICHQQLKLSSHLWWVDALDGHHLRNKPEFFRMY